MPKNPFINDPQFDLEIDDVSLAIYQYIKENFQRSDSTFVNRPSSAPQCVRKRWYQKNGYQADELPPRSSLVFAAGDLAELLYTALVKAACVGEGKPYQRVDFGEEIGSITVQNGKIRLTQYRQDDLYWPIKNGLVLKGHADGWGQRHDGTWELLEFKSASSYGYEEFKKSDIPPDYIKQAAALLMTGKAQFLGVKQVRFCYLRKDTTHLCTKLFGIKKDLIKQVADEFILVDGKEIPDRPFTKIAETYRKKPTGRWTVPWQCGYCGFLKECQGEPNMEFKKDQWGRLKPLYIYETNDEPITTKEKQDVATTTKNKGNPDRGQRAGV